MGQRCSRAGEVEGAGERLWKVLSGAESELVKPGQAIKDAEERHLPWRSELSAPVAGCSVLVSAFLNLDAMLLRFGSGSGKRCRDPVPILQMPRRR